MRQIFCNCKTEAMMKVLGRMRMLAISGVNKSTASRVMKSIFDSELRAIASLIAIAVTAFLDKSPIKRVASSKAEFSVEDLSKEPLLVEGQKLRDDIGGNLFRTSSGKKVLILSKGKLCPKNSLIWITVVRF